MVGFLVISRFIFSECLKSINFLGYLCLMMFRKGLHHRFQSGPPENSQADYSSGVKAC